MKNLSKICLIALYCIFSFDGRADDSLQFLYRDTLRALQTKDSAQIIHAYKYLGDYLSELGEFGKSDTFLTKAVQHAERIDNKHEIGIIYNLLASNASYSGNRPLALRYYHKALKPFAEEKNFDKVAMVLLNMGSEYEYLGDLEMAIAYELKALKNKEASGVRTNLDYYYQSIGQLFKETDIDKWEFYVRKAYEVSKTLPESRIKTKIAIFNDLGGISKIKKDNEAAFVWYDSMLVVSQANNYLTGMGTAYSNRSLLYLSEKKYLQALEDILKALDYAEQTGKTYSLILNRIHAANILLELNRVAEAQKYAGEALDMTTKLKYYPEEATQAHLAMARIGEKTRNWEMAYLHFNSYKEGIDSLRASDVQKNMQNLEIKYQTSEKEKEIVRLDSENKIKSLHLQRSRWQMMGITVFSVLISLVVFLLFKRNRLKEQKQKAELKQKLLRSQMNPHFMFNTLNAINQYIQTNKGLEASDYLARYAKLMRQILENSEEEFVLLRNEIDFLKNYLLMQQLRFNNSFRYNIRIDDSLDLDNIEIPPMIAQPFIENAIEHGVRGVEDGQIDICFKMQDKRLILCVSDNGKGMNKSGVNQEHRSFALKITTERLNMFGGNGDSIQIQSPNLSTEKGTYITLNVPYKNLEA